MLEDPTFQDVGDRWVIILLSKHLCFFLSLISVFHIGYLVFEGPAHTTGKKPEPSWTEPQKTEPLYAVFSGLQPVVTTVFTILTNKKNR